MVSDGRGSSRNRGDGKQEITHQPSGSDFRRNPREDFLLNPPPNQGMQQKDDSPHEHTDHSEPSPSRADRSPHALKIIFLAYIFAKGYAALPQNMKDNIRKYPFTQKEYETLTSRFEFYYGGKTQEYEAMIKIVQQQTIEGREAIRKKALEDIRDLKDEIFEIQRSEVQAQRREVQAQIIPVLTTADNTHEEMAGHQDSDSTASPGGSDLSDEASGLQLQKDDSPHDDADHSKPPQPRAGRASALFLEYKAAEGHRKLSKARKDDIRKNPITTEEHKDLKEMFEREYGGRTTPGYKRMMGIIQKQTIEGRGTTRKYETQGSRKASRSENVAKIIDKMYKIDPATLADIHEKTFRDYISRRIRVRHGEKAKSVDTLIAEKLKRDHATCENMTSHRQLYGEKANLSLEHRYMNEIIKEYLPHSSKKIEKILYGQREKEDSFTGYINKRMRDEKGEEAKTVETLMNAKVVLKDPECKDMAQYRTKYGRNK